MCVHFSEWNEIMVGAEMTLIEIQQCALCLVFLHAYANTIEFNDAHLHARRLQMFCCACIARHTLNAHTIHCLIRKKSTATTNVAHIQPVSFTFVFAFLLSGLWSNSWLSNCKTMEYKRVPLVGFIFV